MTSIVEANPETPMPSTTVMSYAAKIAIVQDRPIMLDYWKDAAEGIAFLGVNGNDEKQLVKSEHEYTSPIAKIFTIENDWIISTENSLYIVPASIKRKRI